MTYMKLAAKCHHYTIICYLSEYLLIPYPLTNTTMIMTMISWPYFCTETSSKSTKKVSPLRMDLGHFCRPPIAHSMVNMTMIIWSTDHIFLIKYHQNPQYPLAYKSVTTDYMINWPYFSNEISSKSTVTTSLQKCHHCVWIWHISADPLIAHSMMNMTMIIWSTDHILLMKSHVNTQ